MIKTEAIQIRDPLIVPHAEEQVYYLFGTTGLNFWKEPKDGFDPAKEGFDAYTSKDLERWSGPVRVFSTPPDFWANHHYWSPEVHAYNGRWYMFASFKAENVCRGVQILVSECLSGPYLPHSERAVTPGDWECLDGTLFIDECGKPWMVFCHEWVQVADGEICALPLTADLRSAAGAPVLLFRASEAAWSVPNPGTNNRVTDGPYLHRTATGALLMLWSTIAEGGYCVGVARSESGTIHGPWHQASKPLFEKDGGHGMLFRTFAGQLMLCLHRPNKIAQERLHILAVEEDGETLQIASRP